MFEKLRALKNQYEQLLERMQMPETYADPALYAKYDREAREIAPVVDAYTAYEKAEGDMNGALELMSEPEFKELAQEVYAAAKAAQCHEFIKQLPNGYDTLIGEGGVFLSGGEEQRVSVARAILKNAPILVLDEATAYADPENEHQMQLALQELIRDKTVLIIAHRLLTIKNADKILVLKDGQIEAEGTHEVLMKNSRTYADMWRAYTATADWQLGRTEVPV